ncbi:MAG: hypothetical protein N2C14_02755, partial [Planctomycetales bacterium]
LGGIECRVRDLSRRRRIVEIRRGGENFHQMESLQEMDGGRMRAAPSRMAPLKEARLDSLESMMDVARRPETLAERLPARPGEGRKLSLRTRKRRKYWKEAETVMRLGMVDLAHEQVVAVGSESRSCRRRSFLLTEYEEGSLPLDDFLRLEFPRSNRLFGDKVGELRRLTARIAETLRIFHELGYRGRNFSAGRIQVRRLRNGEYQARIAGTEDVLSPRRAGDRGRFRDLVGLLASTPEPLTGRLRAAAFLKAYLNVSKLGSREKKWVGVVLAALAGKFTREPVFPSR